MVRIFALAFLFFIAGQCRAQEYSAIPLKADSSLYDNDLLPREFFISRRNLLRENLSDRSAAVFFSSPVRNRSNDVDYEYHQDPNFYYYTGHIKPDAMLMVFKTPVTINGVTADEFIFVKRRNESEETWTGRIPSPEEIALTSGINTVFINTDLADFNLNVDSLDKLLVKFPAEINENSKQQGSIGWMVSKFREKTKSIEHKIDRVQLAKINAKLREVKTSDELKLLQKAVDLTCKGFIEALKATEPGMKEFELESINEFIWKREGSEYAGYPSIVGGGINSCVLHYETNRKKLLAGDIIVMDMGAEYHGYTADVTRSFPVSGKFTTEQRQIYQLVMDAQKAGFEACRPGAPFLGPHQAASKVIEDGLLKLGIIASPEEMKRYFMHGTSHYLGLDVHDAGTYGPLQPNSVITVEPGIYIKEGSPCDRKWWNIGVRLEDDVLITENGHRIMSECVPRSITEIESLMAQKSLFNQFK